MTEQMQVYGVGNAIVDLEVRVDDAFLEGMDLRKGGMTLVPEERQESVLAALEGKDVKRCSGGSVANSIVGVADLGGRPVFCGKVGRDEFGDFYMQDLRRMQVKADCVPQEGRTGTCVVLVTPDAQRTMLTNVGVSEKLGPEDVADGSLEGCTYAYIEGYLFLAQRTRLAALRAIELAKSLGVKVALTVSDPFVVDQCRALFWELIEGPVDLLFCNEQEGKALTEKADAIDVAKALHEHAENVCLTLGANGSILMHGGDVHPIEGVPVEAVDTTGAGDMYAAGILYGITNGLDWPTAGHLASHASARVVTHFGARLPEAFTAEEIDGFRKR